MPNTCSSKEKVGSGRSSAPPATSSSSSRGPHTRARSTPTVANTDTPRNRDRTLHIPASAIQAAKVSLHAVR